MSSQQTIKCPICSAPYHTYSHMAGDQSACHRCRQGAGMMNDVYPQAPRKPQGGEYDPAEKLHYFKNRPHQDVIRDAYHRRMKLLEAVATEYWNSLHLGDYIPTALGELRKDGWEPK